MRGKIDRYAYIESAANVIQSGKPLFETIKGNWNKIYFKNSNHLSVELACGRGEYTNGLASCFPNHNYIGVDIKGDRIWKGSKTAFDAKLDNVGFLRTFIHEIENFFEENELDEIWLTFPDPRPKDKDEKRRLTHPRFLEYYKKLLKPNGWFRLKTDSTSLFDYTLEILNNRSDILEMEYTYNLDDSDLKLEHFGIQTHYEKLFSGKGEKIKYLKLRFKQ